MGDRAAIQQLIAESARHLSREHYDDNQIEAAIATVFGVDTTLIEDGTYFVAESDGALLGCGGWSRRATTHGGDHSPGRDDALLDPMTDAARVRAMYTHPSFKRRGVGRLILSLCEAAAAAEGFTRLELMSTLSGEPLYTAYGFRPLGRIADATGGAPVPLVRMEKAVDPSLLA